MCVYRTVLPENCPPDHAIDQEWHDVYRLVKDKEVNDGDFCSRAELGINYKEKDECKAKACSLWTTKESVCERWRDFPAIRKRYNYLAILTVPMGYGKSDNIGDHISLWLYKDMDLSYHVSDAIEISDV